MPNGAAVAGAEQNSAGGNSLRNVSRFPLSYSFYNTERFAEYVPFYSAEGVAKDKLPFHSSHEVNTYTLKAPLLQSILKKKDYFAVPMQAILPNNWEKFYTNPVIGQDVPVSSGCGVDQFWNKIENSFRLSFSFLSTYASGTPVLDTTLVDYLLRFMVFFEYLYSTGSLMKCLGTSGSSFFHCDDGDGPITFDDLFDRIVSDVFIPNVDTLSVQFGSNAYLVHLGDAPNFYSSTSGDITFREFLEMLRDELATYQCLAVNYVSGKTDANLISSTQVLLSDLTVSNVLNGPNSGNPIDVDHKVPFNTARLWAYQLVCAHFYSNDHVDFIYSAELFRQYIYQLVCKTSASTRITMRTFSVNGYDYIYDALSAYFTSVALAAITGTSGIFVLNTNSTSGSPYNFDSISEVYAYWTALLHYKHSLRFMDYFTGARSLPLAIGDHEVDVNTSNKVDVLDLARGRMMTKFLQSINRSGRKFGNYMKELFGVVPAYDYHNPMYLAHTSDVVGSNVNQNTGADQRAANAFTSNMQSNASRYAFTFNPDRDCILIGISYYDIPRVYIKAIERQNFVLDRFDMFNPYLQYVGDQPIYRAEIGSRDASLVPFGYQNHDMQYKQRYNQAAGGFANPSTGLDNWIFVSDSLNRQYATNISPSFIRSFNCELDHFYTSLTGWSNGSYFHFIVRYDNRQDAVRPMAYAPVIA